MNVTRRPLMSERHAGPCPSHIPFLPVLLFPSHPHLVASSVFLINSLQQSVPATYYQGATVLCKQFCNLGFRLRADSLSLAEITSRPSFPITFLKKMSCISHFAKYQIQATVQVSISLLINRIFSNEPILSKINGQKTLVKYFCFIIMRIPP